MLYFCDNMIYGGCIRLVPDVDSYIYIEIFLYNPLLSVHMQ